MAIVMMGAIVSVASAAPKTVDRFVGAGASGNDNALGGVFLGPRDVTVNVAGVGGAAAGDTYVADTGNNRIQVLSAAGAFKFAFGRDVVRSGAAGDTGTGFEICAVASDCKDGSAGTLGGEMTGAQGVAVDQATGMVYVRDVGTSSSSSNRRVQQFTAAGTFVRAWGWDVVQPGGTGDTAGGTFEICSVASECQAAPAQTGTGAGQIATSSSNSSGIAVSPVDGDVFVSDPANRRINRYNADGTVDAVPSIGSASNFGSNQPLHIALDSRGILYASDSSNSNEVDRYDLADANGGGIGFLASISSAALGGNGATEGLEVDPDNDGGGADEDVLYVSRNPSTGTCPGPGCTVVRQYGPANDPGLTAAPVAADETAHGGTALGTSSTTGLGLDPATGTVKVALFTGNACGGSCHGVFHLDDDGTGTDIAATGVAGSAATATTIEVLGTVDPADGLVRYRFEYSPDGVNYQQTAYVPLSGTGPVEVSQQLTGLLPNSLYRIRLRVEKVMSPTTLLTDTSPEAIAATAAAAPLAETLGTAARTATAATLRGLVDPQGSPTTYRFEYGPAGGSFDRQVPVPDGPAGSGNGESLVLQPVSGLLPETAYHYRLVATNNVGTTVANTQTFTTEAITGDPLPLASRAHELVSPAYKLGGVGVGAWGSGQGDISTMGFAAPEGERFAAQGSTGSMLVDGAQAYANDWAFADRMGPQQGWISHSPFTHPATSSQLAKFVAPQSADERLSRLAWRTNNSTIEIFPETLAFPSSINPSFLSSWGGRWEIFGPTDTSQLPGSLPLGTRLCETAFAADGSGAICTVRAESGIAAIRGLAGPDDPTSTSFPDLVAGRSVYLADTSGELGNSLAATGDRTLVNVCSDGTEIPNVTGSGDLVSQACPDLAGRFDLVHERGAASVDIDAHQTNGGRGPLANVVSEGGRRVFFVSPDPLAAGVPNGTAAFCSGTGGSTTCPPQLFVRQDNGDGTFTTRWISKAEDGLFGNQDASLTGIVRFERATPDGDKVLFRTNSPLTADDRNGTGSAPVTTGNASDQSWDLYLYDFPDAPDADPADGELTRVSAGPAGNGDCNVQPGGSSPTVAGSRHVSNDGARVLLTCAAPLPGVPAAGGGTITEPGGEVTTTAETNLYAYDADELQAERYSFVARVPRSTAADVANCAGAGAGFSASLFPLPTGDFVGHSNCVRGTSDGSFVTFWTAGRLTGDDPNATTADIYGYDAESDELSRLTAPQGGVGGTYACGMTTAQQCYGDNGYDLFEPNLERAPRPMLGVATDPLVPGDRLAFFQSKSRLVPDDTDDQMDVYQWRNGDLSLLTGSGTSGAYYKGNDRTGRNVYFVTPDSMSWQDTDAVYDVYTARIGGGIAEPLSQICAVLAGGCRSESGEVLASAAAVMPATDGNADPGARKRLTVSGLSAKARKAAARSGKLTLSIRTSKAGKVSAVAKARIGKRTQRVASKSVQVRKAGKARLRLRLSPLAKRTLRKGKVLKLTIQVRSPGARSRSMTVRLPGALS